MSSVGICIDRVKYVVSIVLKLVHAVSKSFFTDVSIAPPTLFRFVNLSEIERREKRTCDFFCYVRRRRRRRRAFRR